MAANGITLKPGDADANLCCPRRFILATIFKKSGRVERRRVSSNKLVTDQYPTSNVAMLETFKGQTPYELHGGSTTTLLSS